MRLMAAFTVGMDVLLDRFKGCLWGVYIGDALAMPVHWYYDRGQLKRDFGTLTTYQAPKSSFPGSIMNLSNTGGGGRGGDKGSIVGDVILHGKKQYWQRGAGYHYHHGLRAGENTLEGQLVRVLIRSMTANGGLFNRDDFLERYISFMTTPGTHNDVYAGTCHRMFFKNWSDGKDPKRCADNDGHNVDTIDGLVPGVAVALSRGLGSSDAKAQATLRKDITDCISVNRASRPLEQYGEVYAEMLQEAVAQGPEGLVDICKKAGRKMGVNVERLLSMSREDPMVACYIESSFPAFLYFAAKYGNDPEQALIKSTNAGGENVARGAVLGALLGAAHGMSAFPKHLIDGLVAKDEIAREIDRFTALAAQKAVASIGGGGTAGVRAEEDGCAAL